MTRHSAQPRQALLRRLSFLKVLGSSLGCLLAIGIAGFLSVESGYPMLIPPFGASCVILL